MRDTDADARAARRALTAAADVLCGRHWGVRLVVAVAALLVAGPVGFVSVLTAGEAITGCGFVVCGDPQPVLGVVLLVPAGAASVAVVAVLTWAMSPVRARAVSLRSYALAVVAAAAGLGVVAGFGATGGAEGHAVAVSAMLVLAVMVVTDRRRLTATPMALLHAIEDLPRVLRLTLTGTAVTADLLWVAFVAAVSSCDFAGGRCPDPTPDPLLDRDGVWLAGGWTVVAGVSIVLLTERRRDPAAWLTAAGAAVAAGLVGA